MKKIIGMVLIVGALILAGITYAMPAIAENAETKEIEIAINASPAPAIPSATVETINNEVEETTEITETVYEEVIEETEPVIPDNYPWMSMSEEEMSAEITQISDKLSLKKFGTVIIESVGINTPLGFGGTDSSDIDGRAGIHEDLSDPNGLFILGHYYQNGTCFAPLPKVEVGAIVIVNTPFGSYSYEVIESSFVTEEEYAADNWSICTGFDLTLATCEWEGGIKGRCVVHCELITPEI